MWLIVDTNQVAFLPPKIESDRIQRQIEGITVPAHVFAEILLQRNPSSSLSALRNYNVRIGLESGEVLRLLCALSIEEIITFKPFPPTGSAVDNKYSNLIQALRNPSAQHIEWAKTVKNKNRVFIQKLLGRPEKFRRKAKNAGINKIDNINEAIALAGRGSNSFLGSIIMPQVQSGRYSGCNDELRERLYDTIMQNEYMARFMKAILVFILSISRYWKNESLNYDVNCERDDWADITIPLYASDGDLILTKDNKLRLTVQTLECLNKVAVVTADDLGG